MKLMVEKIFLPQQSSFVAKKIILGEHTAPIHSHPNYELNYIKTGWGRRFVGNHFSDFNEGDLVLLGPDLPHGWQIEGKNRSGVPQSIVLHFAEEFLGSSLLGTPELQNVSDLLHRSVQGIFFRGIEVKKIAAKLEKMTKENGLKGLILLLQIFEQLLSVKDFEYLSVQGYLDSKQNVNYNKMQKIYKYIMHNFQNKITLSCISGEVNLSPGSFCRYFKRQTSRTFFDYLKEVRIGYACKQLMETSKPVSVICYDSGYNNLGHFNNQFKEVKKMTPHQFRKIIRTAENN
jgi:AraC-like DNA-binding protein